MFGNATKSYRYGETGPSYCRNCGLELERGDKVRLIDMSREWMSDVAEHEDCRMPLASAIRSLRYQLNNIEFAQAEAAAARATKK